jgi:hypothetical protein
MEIVHILQIHLSNWNLEFIIKNPTYEFLKRKIQYISSKSSCSQILEMVFS